MLNKPAGVTSRWAVDRVARLVRPAKAGHAGTLDPLATGVLVVCVGRASRLIGHVQAMVKSYRATFVLGCSSPTEDVEGPLTQLIDPPVPTRPALEAAAQALTGDNLQRPPAFSALKVAGQRAYDLARRGADVQLTPRPITVYRFEILRYDYPQVEAAVQCSSGTYVRSLGRDLAAAVGSAAVMSALVRTAVGLFDVETAIDPAALDRQTLPQHLRSPLDALGALPRITVTAEQCHKLWLGQPIDLPDGDPSAAEIAAVDAADRLAAIVRPKAGGLWPVHNFP